MRFDGGMTSARFAGYVRHVLAPTLREPGQVVIADNLRAHYADDARAAIEAQGARLIHLPPYSPDFDPIEHAFSKVKHALRRAAPRSDDALPSGHLGRLRHHHLGGRRRLVRPCGYTS